MFNFLRKKIILKPDYFDLRDLIILGNNIKVIIYIVISFSLSNILIFIFFYRLFTVLLGIPFMQF